MTFAESMQAHASAYLRHCLHRAKGNVKLAARDAGMHRTQFYRLVQRCDIDLEAIRREPTAPQTPAQLLGSWQMPRTRIHL